MTPDLTLAQTFAACVAFLLLHAVAYYVFVAVAAPVWMPRHATTLAALEGERR